MSELQEMNQDPSNDAATSAAAAAANGGNIGTGGPTTAAASQGTAGTASSTNDHLQETPHHHHDVARDVLERHETSMIAANNILNQHEEHPQQLAELPQIEHHHDQQEFQIHQQHQRQLQRQLVQIEQHQHHDEYDRHIHASHQNAEANTVTLDQIQQRRHQHQHQHENNQHSNVAEYHHGNAGPIATLEGTEIVHIANMDTTAPSHGQQRNHHQAHPQQQMQVDAHANVNMADPNHNAVPVPVQMNVMHHPQGHMIHHPEQYSHDAIPVQPPPMHHPTSYVHHDTIHQHQVAPVQVHEHANEHEHDHHEAHEHEHEHEHHEAHYQTLEHEQQQQPTELSWHDYFNILQSHQTANGTLDIEPNTHPALEQWIFEQRVLYEEQEKGVETSLTAERKLLLDALGFEWEGGGDLHQHQHQHHTSENEVVQHGQPNSHDHHDTHAPSAQEHQHQQEYATHDDEGHSNGELAVNIGTVDEFNERLQQLQTFKDVNENSNIPYDYKDDSMPDIARWAIHQRQFYHEGSLTQDRVDALLTMGFDFNIAEGSDLKIPMFSERFTQLQDYKQLHGDIKISRNAGPALHGLGEWLHAQKLDIRNLEEGRPSTLTEDRYKLLLDLGIDMTTPTEPEINVSQEQQDVELTEEEEKENNRASKWDDKYHDLKQYKLQHGHTNVPRRSRRDPSKDSLGEWVHFQRRQHRNLLTGKNSTMSITRKKALDYVEFQWTRGLGSSTTTRTGTTYSTETKQAVQDQVKKIAVPDGPETWNLKFEEYKLYVQAHGHGNVPKNYKDNPFLRRWVRRQKESYHIWRQVVDHPEYSAADREEQNGMTEERYEKLLNAGFIFEQTLNGEGIDPVTGAPYITSYEEEEEEKPTMEDEDDIEIFVGYDTTLSPPEIDDSNGQVTHQVPALEHVNAMAQTLNHHVETTEAAPISVEQPQKEVELNESDVHAILDGKEEHEHHVEEVKQQYQHLQQQSHHLEHPHDVPMPSIQDGHGSVIQGLLPDGVQQQAQMHIGDHSMEQQQQQHHQQEDILEAAPLRRLTAKVRVQWEERVLELIQFKLRKTHCNVPAKWKPNPDIATWAWRQRVQYRRYRQGQTSVLTAQRICLLADLGFEFVALDHHGQPIDDVDSKHFMSAEMSKLQNTKKTAKKGIKGTPKSRFKEGKWLESLAKVVKFKEENGNCNVPRKWKRDPTLGEWVHFQRRQFRLRQLSRRNHMTDERIRKLEAIGFEWSRGTSNQPSYIRVYEQNKELQAQGGIPMQHPEHQGVEASATGEVPQISVEEQAKAAAEIAAVVEEQMRNPADVEHQHQGHQVLEQQQYQHHEYQHHSGVVVDHNGQYHQHPQYNHHQDHADPQYHEEHLNEAQQEENIHV